MPSPQNDTSVGVAVGVVVGVPVGVAVGVLCGGPVGVGVGVAVGVAVDVGPAWATADQTVAASATITRDPTTERWVVVFDMVLPLKSEA
jgi:hypothetical protein